MAELQKPDNKPPTGLCDLLNARYAPVQTALMAHLDIIDIIMLKKTNKALYTDISHYLKNNDYNINQKLKPFFQDPVTFRSVQARCDALLWGLFARDFMSRRTGGSSSLLINVNDNLPLMCSYLESSGYTKMPERNGSSDAPSKGLTVEYRNRLPNGLVKMVCICTDPAKPAVQILLDKAKLTPDLHLISWNKAVSLVPRSTYMDRGSYLLDVVHQVGARTLDFHERDGFNVKGIHWDSFATEPPKTVKMLKALRKIGDQHTWAIDLDTAGVTPPTVPDAFLQSTTFRLIIDKYGSTTRYRINAATFLAHPVLKYRYTSATRLDGFDSAPPNYCLAINNLDQRLHDATVIELTKMREADRPNGYDDVLARRTFAKNLRGEFTPPVGWKYYDEEVLRQLEKLWKEHMSLQNE
jgi:hypothetical protein